VPETGDTFRTGQYHRSFQRKHTRLQHLLRSIQLRVFYETSARLVELLGWPDPLAGANPRVLLCGSASPYTTLTFARFVSQRHTTASIEVLDISSYALDESERFVKAHRDVDAAHIAYIEGDALRMPFADASFDSIETDFFIQFFTPSDQAILFREWYRVLKPGGVITTRDWLMEQENFAERLVEGAKNWLIRHILGPVTYSASAREVCSALSKLGFEPAIFPVRIPGIRLRIPAMQYLLIHKL
jgi:SAM-dependent methyltransferase